MSIELYAGNALSIPVGATLRETIEGNEEFRFAAINIARIYRENLAEMVEHLRACDRAASQIEFAFRGEAKKYQSYNSFGVDYRFDGKSFYGALDLDDVESAKKFEPLVVGAKRRAWRILSDKLGILKIMSVKRRTEFEKQLESGDLPEIDEDTILQILLGLAGDAASMATEAAKEVFDYLRPRKSDNATPYATNADYFRVGLKVILTYAVERGWGNVGGWRFNYNREKYFIAIDNTFHILDGKGILRDGETPLVAALKKAENGVGETDYFKFKCFKNGNIHLAMKRPDLVKQLNGLATGDYVLGSDQI